MRSNGDMTSMLKISKDDALQFLRVFLYWGALLLVFIMLEAFMGLLSEVFSSGTPATFILWMSVSSLFLAVYSTFIPPIRHFLEAQFEHGDLLESLEQVQNSIKDIQSELDEIKRLISEIKLHRNEKAE